MSCCGRRGFVRAAQQFFLSNSNLRQAIESSQYDRCRASAARKARARRVRRSNFRLLVDAPGPARAALGAAYAQRATGTRTCRSWLQIEEGRRDGGKGSYERMIGGRSSLRTSIESRSVHAQLMPHPSVTPCTSAIEASREGERDAPLRALLLSSIGVEPPAGARRPRAAHVTNGTISDSPSVKVEES